MVNIRNQDDMCLKHYIAADTNPPKNNASRVDYYISKKNQEKLYKGFDKTGMSIPASLRDTHRNESNNPGLAIFCFSLDEDNRKARPLSLFKV
jgi:hypothetical protein